MPTDLVPVHPASTTTDDSDLPVLIAASSGNARYAYAEFFAGIESPNPYWLASGPPTNTYVQVAKAFDLGWGGAVWQTVGQPILNVFSRYGSIDLGSQRMVGFNNIELISDRPIEDNLREIAEVKKKYPKHAVITSLMVETNQKAWHDMVLRAQDTGTDGFELNFGCPHGMSERGMGAAR